jgi:DNA (cytosine-5)-methyltransferase 1
LTRQGRGLVAMDLFSGCGAVTHGLRRAGFQVAAGVEVDPYRARTFSLNHPETPVLIKDIRRVTGEEILSTAGLRPGRLDLLAGCPPCQGFSRIRRRNGDVAVPDKRNRLVGEFGRLVSELRPKAVLMENVPGLENNRRYRSLLALLRRSGYSFAWDILDMASFGVPQRRRRLVLLALRGSVLPDLARIRRGPSRTVRDAIAVLPRVPLSQRPLHYYKQFRSGTVADRIRFVPPDGGSRTDLPWTMHLRCHTGAYGFHDVYGRMRWDEPSPTITGGCNNPSKGRFLHPTKHRAITILEAARLQSFPVWYRFSLDRGRYPIAEMIGEAVPPLFIQRVAKYIKSLLPSRGSLDD